MKQGKLVENCFLCNNDDTPVGDKRYICDARDLKILTFDFHGTNGVRFHLPRKYRVTKVLNFRL